jgi:hypothetical protein
VHFDWIHLPFTDNGIDPNKHSLMHAAVSDVPGDVLFYVGAATVAYAPNEWYWQELTKDYEVVQNIEEKAYCGFQVRRHNLGGHPKPASDGHLKGSSALLVEVHGER